MMKKKKDVVTIQDEKIGNNSALHKAIRNQENRSVDIILSYMSKIPKNNSKSFQDIMPDLVDYNNFKTYLLHLAD